ncbi:dethiobiotin synthase [Pedobacter sp. SYP-B3415]|uniref:dethiobiotin synthase n=1 Tax=Pedobacter sp. SYP-B3415 TaxID=2496641 RepID=UPI00101D8686|nr:dethiobiotin synthase [Pedobacter sp. SYP-B3415]
MHQGYFITGIGTGIGKTVVSAVITEKLKADYWKPVQSGDLDASDSMSVGALISNNRTQIHPEIYRLNTPLSPHQSAAIDGVEIELDGFSLPQTQNRLVVEGAGGLMVPLAEKLLITDLIRHLNLPVILVSRHYLGSINHTLLSWHFLKEQEIPVRGIIFNGPENHESKRYILQYTALELLGELPELDQIDAKIISELGANITLT